MSSDGAANQHKAANGDSLQRKRRKVIVFSVEGKEVTACGQHDKVRGADLASTGHPTCQTNHNTEAPALLRVLISPPTATETPTCSTNGQCESRASSAGVPATASAEKVSLLPAGISDQVLVGNGGAASPVHQFFLPSDDDEETDEVRELYEQAGAQQDGSAPPPLGLQNGIFQEASLPPPPAPCGRPGVQFLGPNHMFTVVPVGSGELRTDKSETKIPAACAATNVDADVSVRRVSSAKSQLFATCGHHYSPYSTLRAAPGGRRVSISPSHTIGRGGQVAVAYNPYHTVTGLMPSSYQCSEGGLRRVSTSKREYGVGGGGASVPPSLVNVVLPPGSAATGAPFASGLHRVRTLPCPTTTSRKLSRNITHIPDGGSMSEHNSMHSLNQNTVHSLNQNTVHSLNQNTMHSLNQMTLLSAGGLSIDVGSTDGRNVKIHGAVESPEQLPLLPTISG